jgi:hypothetical protein
MTNTSSFEIQIESVVGILEISGVWPGLKTRVAEGRMNADQKTRARTPRHKYQTGTIDIETWPKVTPCDLDRATKSEKKYGE